MPRAKIEKAAGRRPEIIACDLATAEGLRAAVGGSAPDILVTNAGGPPAKDFRELSATDWDLALRTNFLSGVELIRTSLDSMIARGFGRIVNITSVTVRMPVERMDLSTSTRLGMTGYVAGVGRRVGK